MGQILVTTGRMMETAADFDNHILTFGEKLDGDELVANNGITKGLVYYLSLQHKVKKEFNSRLIRIATRNGIVLESSVNKGALDRCTLRLVNDIKRKKTW